MSKKKKKKGKKKKKPNIPLESILRIRVDKLYADAGLVESSDEALQARLDEVAQGIKPESFFSVFLAGLADAPEAWLERLDAAVPGWLAARGWQDTLYQLLEQQKLGRAHEERVCGWLEAAGVSLEEYKEKRALPTVFRCYQFLDEMQGFAVGLFYTDPRQIRVRGFMPLFDFQPPWEGSTKDIMMTKVYPEEDAEQAVLAPWLSQGMEVEEIDGGSFKKLVIESLLRNQSEGIRLPKDLIRQRDFFFEHVMRLPDLPDTPSFTEEDFDELAALEKTPELLREAEQMFGYQTRLPDGSEILMQRPDDW